MSNEAVQPLRINKGTPTSSPVKMSPFQRPLSEITPGEKRRNSPSFNQTTRKMLSVRESSPFDVSPFTKSPKLLWQNRDPASPGFDSENSFQERDPSTSPRKTSIENLKKASRVKNSNIFAIEQKNAYDPSSSPQVERPTVPQRPMSVQMQWDALGSNALTTQGRTSPLKGHRRTESSTNIPLYSPTKSPGKFFADTSSDSLTKKPLSPAKSSLADFRKSAAAFMEEPGSDEENQEDYGRLTPRALHRHQKSVTFDAAPPQINEYEMVTPVPSSIASGSREGSYDDFDDSYEDSYERASSIDRDDSFDASLEDAEKTPVVLPGDWRHMSPEVANTDLAATFDDPFTGKEGSPMPSASPHKSERQQTPLRSNSTTSDGESRPLPPIPGMGSPVRDGHRRNSLSATAERVSSLQRTLPSPPPAAAMSKDDFFRMRSSSIGLEDRVQMMSVQDNKHEPDFENRDFPKESEEPEEGLTEMLSDIEIPHISRESILRRVKSRNFDEDDEYDYRSPSPENTEMSRLYDYADLDPDVPIPSREGSSNYEVQGIDDTVVVKRESSEDDVLDLYTVAQQQPEFANSPARTEDFDYGRENSVIRHPVVHHIEDDEESRYSPDSIVDESTQIQSSSTDDDEGPPTPTALEAPKASEHPKVIQKPNRMSLSQFASFLADDNFELGLEDYMSNPPSIKESASPAAEDKPSAQVAEQGTRHPLTPPEQLQPPHALEETVEPGTPDSVIHHPVEELEEVPAIELSTPARESPTIPERIASVKATGGKLKTRPSATPADLEALAAQRRRVSGEDIPAIPQRSPKRQSLMLTPADEALDPMDTEPVKETAESQAKRIASGDLRLSIPVPEVAEDLSFGLDKEFDRVIEAQKVYYSSLFPLPASCIFPPYTQQSSIAAEEDIGPAAQDGGDTIVPKELSANVYIRSQKGYLMRQNTKIVVASNRQFSDENPPPMSPTGEAAPVRGTKSANSSPRKGSQEKKQAFLTTEPWNGKMRRRSVRQPSGDQKKRVETGPVPPMPGQESAVDAVAEEQSFGVDESEEGQERGRLFVKVVGVKDLDLPLPKNERTWFQLTLDNGLHCVTTSWLELGKSAPIGQEFELVVLNDLEFQLTLQTKLTQPKQEPLPVVSEMASSPTKTLKTQKSSTFGRMFGSPKKKREEEIRRQQQEEQERKHAEQVRRRQEAERKRASLAPTAWDLLHDLVAPDGSFARAYISLKNHEQQAFGRPCMVDIPCFNEWAVETDASIASSVKSKRGGVARRPPYKIGKLQVQLLYVPKPKGAKDDDMPKSMNACIREMKDAEANATRTWEGLLSQQGGDCPYWRRRYFKLVGPKLTAYHESTRQPRATINLSKASKLIDDRKSLVNSSTDKKGGRRKSAFAEEEEGYMFVEEGFRIRFANGETIDFYADNAADKEGWMRVLSETVGKESSNNKAWTEMVLAKERKEKDAETSAPKETRKMSAPASAPAPAQQEPPPRKRQESGMRQPVPRAGSRSAPTSPVKRDREPPMPRGPPPPMEKSPRHMPTSPRQKEQTLAERRQQVRSMVF